MTSINNIDWLDFSDDTQRQLSKYLDETLQNRCHGISALAVDGPEDISEDGVWFGLPEGMTYHDFCEYFNLINELYVKHGHRLKAKLKEML